MVSYIKRNGVGLFLSTTGIIFLILGVIFFIFFLGIDPGYGWIKNIDLTKNYIMIFVAIAVVFAGVALITIGHHLNDLKILAEKKQIRCEQILTGKAANVLNEEWYVLRDSKRQEFLHAYLFQKKSNRNNYKIIISHDPGIQYSIKNLIISSPAIPTPINAEEESICPGVVEKDINIDFVLHQKLEEHVGFDISINMLKSETSEGLTTYTDKKTIKLTLQNTGEDKVSDMLPPRQAISDSFPVLYGYK